MARRRAVPRLPACSASCREPHSRCGGLPACIQLALLSCPCVQPACTTNAPTQLQVSDQLLATTMLLGNAVDRLLVWACAVGRLHGACAPHAVYRLADGVQRDRHVPAASWPDVTKAHDSRSPVEDSWSQAVACSVELCSFALVNHLSVRAMATMHSVTCASPLSRCACWQAGLQEASARLAEAVNGDSAALPWPYSPWPALLLTLNKALYKPGRSAAITEARALLTSAMGSEVRRQGSVAGCACLFPKTSAHHRSHSC